MKTKSPATMSVFLLLVITLAGMIPVGCSTGVYRGAYYGNVEAIQAGLNSGENIESARNGWTPLIVASYRGNLEAVKFLIQKGANVDAKTNDGFTALDYARSYGYPEIAEFLKSKGAKSTSSESVSNVLFAAAQRGDVNAIEKWLQRSSDVEGIHQGMSSLQVACVQKHEQVAALLIDKGANVNFRDSSGRTPLMYATQSGLTATVKLLVEKGADINAKSSGMSAVDFAKSSGNWSIAYFLIARAWGRDWTEEKTVNTFDNARQTCQNLGMRLPSANQLLRAHKSGFGRSFLNQTLWTSDEETSGLVRVVNVLTGIMGSASKTSVNAYRCIGKNSDDQKEELSPIIALGQGSNYFLLRSYSDYHQAKLGCSSAGGRLPSRQDALHIQSNGIWRELYALGGTGYFFLSEVTGDGRVYIASITNDGHLTVTAGLAMLQPLCVR